MSLFPSEPKSSERGSHTMRLLRQYVATLAVSKRYLLEQLGPSGCSHVNYIGYKVVAALSRQGYLRVHSQSEICPDVETIARRLNSRSICTTIVLIPIEAACVSSFLNDLMIRSRSVANHHYGLRCSRTSCPRLHRGAQHPTSRRNSRFRIVIVSTFPNVSPSVSNHCHI